MGDDDEDIDALAEIEDEGTDDEGSDVDDFVAKAEDCYLLAAQASDEHSVLEVYCYDEPSGNLFGAFSGTCMDDCARVRGLPGVTCCVLSLAGVCQCITTSRCRPSPWRWHGWTVLPSLQVRSSVWHAGTLVVVRAVRCVSSGCHGWVLCLLSCGAVSAAGAEQVGSFVAVGTFHPSIEIWNLDVIDSLEPAAVLGGFKDEAAALKKKTKKGKKKAAVCGKLCRWS